MKLEEYKENMRKIKIVVGNPQQTMSQDRDIPAGVTIENSLDCHVTFIAQADMTVNTVMIQNNSSIVYMQEFQDILMKKDEILVVEWHLIMNNGTMKFSIDLTKKPFKELLKGEIDGNK